MQIRHMSYGGEAASRPGSFLCSGGQNSFPLRGLVVVSEQLLFLIANGQEIIRRFPEPKCVCRNQKSVLPRLLE
jgi:hypothetical protein